MKQLQKNIWAIRCKYIQDHV